ncbi:MAG: hypothetical protein LBB17_01860 [Puniceicoccales bacterium]|nr:hypothetical protein [Puniceicoccales bacterium]
MKRCKIDKKSRESLIKLTPSIMADREIKIQCPSCGKCELTISDIEGPDKRFVRVVQCHDCGLYAEMLGKREE